MLLDLREHLLQGDDWEETLDLFLACRERLEAEHYLPFYRLRRLIANLSPSDYPQIAERPPILKLSRCRLGR